MVDQRSCSDLFPSLWCSPAPMGVFGTSWTAPLFKSNQDREKSGPWTASAVVSDCTRKASTHITPATAFSVVPAV